MIGALRCKAVKCRWLHPVIQQAENIILDNGEIVTPGNVDNRIPALARHGEGGGILQGGNEIENFELAGFGGALKIFEINPRLIHGNRHGLQVEAEDH